MKVCCQQRKPTSNNARAVAKSASGVKSMMFMPVTVILSHVTIITSSFRDWANLKNRT
jgi:hypothetical protein